MVSGWRSSRQRAYLKAADPGLRGHFNQLERSSLQPEAVAMGATDTTWSLRAVRSGIRMGTASMTPCLQMR